MKPLASLLVILLLAACGKEALETRRQVENGVEVGLLFTNDGCNIWRFEDAGRYRYYADCGSISSSYQETRVRSTGKTTTTYQVTIPDEVPNGRPKR